MDSDMKWAMIALIFIMGGPMVGLGFSEYSKSQCRIEAIKAGVDADKINMACGVK